MVSHVSHCGELNLHARIYNIWRQDGFEQKEPWKKWTKKCKHVFVKGDSKNSVLIKERWTFPSDFFLLMLCAIEDPSEKVKVVCFCAEMKPPLNHSEGNSCPRGKWDFHFNFFLVLFLFFLSHEHQINDKWINSVNYPNVLWGDYCHHINGKKKTWTSITGGHERKTTSASDKAYGLIVFKKIVVNYLLSTSVFSRAFQTHFLKFDKKCQNSRLPYSLVYQLSTTTHGLHQRKTTKAPERYNAWPLKY